MKKKTKIIIAALIILLFIPIPSATLKDGGTKTFSALTYKIVSWNKIMAIDYWDEGTLKGASDTYQKTEFYIFPFNFLSVDRLWNMKDRGDGWANQNLSIETVCARDHSPAKEEQTVSDPEIGGWCGNTQASIVIDGDTFTFILSDAITLNELYLDLSFKEKPCQCDSGIKIITEFGEFSVNLEKFFVRSDKGQSQLTKEQAEQIKEIIERQT